MEQLKILNKKETHEILDIVKQQWGAEIELDYGIMKNSHDKIYIASKAVFGLPLEKLKISAVGMYFGELISEKHGQVLRVSIEGSQLIGPKADNHIVELDDLQARDWLRGLDLDISTDERAFVLIKHKDDFLGCGKAMGDKILNYIPKARRVTSSD